VDLREWSIYRSSLSHAEVQHMQSALNMLTASLEVYAPLNPSALTANDAQSMAQLVSEAGAAFYDISVFGSSVANGHTCTGNCSGVSSSSDAGGCYQSRLRVFQRSLGRTIFNNCRNGDTTSLLLGRFSELLSVNPKHVLIGLSLANEGLLNPELNMQQVFDQYAAGMQQLINESRSNSIIPFIGSCYPNSAYNSTQYDYITQMNILSQTWDVPQVNFLGTVDDGTGKWSVVIVNIQSTVLLGQQDISPMEATPTMTARLSCTTPLCRACWRPLRQENPRWCQGSPTSRARRARTLALSASPRSNRQSLHGRLAYLFASSTTRSRAALSCPSCSLPPKTQSTW